jgi:Zn-dependent protease with chaperone function
VLLVVIMFHAFWIRLITTQFLKRSHSDRVRASLWHADLLFALSIVAFVALHLAEIILWTSALVFSGIVSDWSRAAYFAANCFTALGQPFALPQAWRIVAPIIAMSGIFTFAWTASVLVNFVSRYNEMRADIIGRGQSPR